MKEQGIKLRGTAGTVGKENYVESKGFSIQRRIIVLLSLFSAFAWILFSLSTQILWGPHINLMRTIITGAATGSSVGLIVSALQWSLVRHITVDSWLWIPACTIGWTLAGIIGGFLSYPINKGDIYGFSIVWRTLVVLASVGFTISVCQWIVLRKWVRHAHLWILDRSVGFAVSGVSGPLLGICTAIMTFYLVGGQKAWPMVLVAYYLGTGAGLGATVYIATRRALFRMLHNLRDVPSIPATLPAQSEPAEGGTQVEPQIIVPV